MSCFATVKVCAPTLRGATDCATSSASTATDGALMVDLCWVNALGDGTGSCDDAPRRSYSLGLGRHLRVATREEHFGGPPPSATGRPSMTSMRFPRHRPRAVSWLLLALCIAGEPLGAQER